MTKHEIEHIIDGLELLKKQYRISSDRIFGRIFYKEVEILQEKMLAIREKMIKADPPKKMTKEDMDALFNDFAKGLFSGEDDSTLRKIFGGLN